jgi:hypothetical protein
MGHNRSGDIRKKRLRRRRRLEERLAERAPREGEGGAAPAETGSPGILGSVKDLATGVAGAVGGVLHGHADKGEGAAHEPRS